MVAEGRGDFWNGSLGLKRLYIVFPLIVDTYLYFRIHNQDACGSMPCSIKGIYVDFDIRQISRASMIVETSRAVVHQHDACGRFADERGVAHPLLRCDGNRQDDFR